MEPYLPFIDQKVYHEIKKINDSDLTLQQRASLVKILHEPCQMSAKMTTLHVAIESTCASLALALEQKKSTLLTSPNLLPIPLKLSLNT